MTVRLRGPALAVWTVFAAFCLLIGLPRLIDEDLGEPSQPIAVAFVVLGVLLGASVLLVRVTVTSERIVVVNLVRRWTGTIDEVRGIELGSTGLTVLGGRLRQPLLVLVLDDRRVPVYATTNGRVDELLALVAQLPGVEAEVDWAVFAEDER